MKIGRILLIHANNREEKSASADDIVALTGLKYYNWSHLFKSNFIRTSKFPDQSKLLLNLKQKVIRKMGALAKGSFF